MRTTTIKKLKEEIATEIKHNVNKVLSPYEYGSDYSQDIVSEELDKAIVRGIKNALVEDNDRDFNCEKQPG